MPSATNEKGHQESTGLLFIAELSISRGRTAHKMSSHWKTACIAFLLYTAVAFARTKVVYNKLVDFTGANGLAPGVLVQGIDGNLYGPAFGPKSGPPHHHTYGNGLVFKMTPAGQLTTFYTFCTQANCPNDPSRLILATDGNFYGTMATGGANNPSNAGGTVFQITQAGTLTTLYTFCALANCADGSVPGVLIQGSDGNLYGTTILGGTNAKGTVFKITPGGGNLTTLYNFCSLANCADGTNANGGIATGLTQGSDGNFYGSTAGGGANNQGTVFKITPEGELTTLYNFCSQANCADGAAPLAGVTQATDGNFYGTTYGGGTGLNGNALSGTLFRITPGGALTTLHSFCTMQGCPDGYFPSTAPIQATDGNLYGTTAGTVYNITLAGTLTTLHSIPNAYANPSTTLLQDTNGVFYGTTPTGGKDAKGTIYSLAVGLGPFVETVQPSGTVGQTIMILGQGFTGTTSVSFNGTSASYIVVSDGYLTARVPSGAKTGPITVLTPGGIVTSNKPFVVVP